MSRELLTYKQAEIDTLTRQVAEWKSTAEQHKENYDAINGALRIQVAEQKAEIERLSGINSRLVDVHNSHVVQGARYEEQLTAAQAEIDRLTEKVYENRDESALLKQAEAEIKRLKGMVDEIQAARHVQKEHNKLLEKICVLQKRLDLLGGSE